MSAPVVIVDSNRDGLEMYMTALALEGIPATAAASAGEALEVIARDQPRALVTELRLPGTGGADLIRRVRSTVPSTYIVGLTAFEDANTREAREAGCDIVLPLPCLPATLVRQLRRALG
jgi:two-component system nitrogen regulation response regulator GlnG